MFAATRRSRMCPMDAITPKPADYWKQQIERALLAPVRSMRREYLPLLMVYPPLR